MLLYCCCSRWCCSVTTAAELANPDLIVCVARVVRRMVRVRRITYNTFLLMPLAVPLLSRMLHASFNRVLMNATGTQNQPNTKYNLLRAHTNACIYAHTHSWSLPMSIGWVIREDATHCNTFYRRFIFTQIYSHTFRLYDRIYTMYVQMYIIKNTE